MADRGSPAAREWMLLLVSLGVALLLAEAVCRLALPRPGFVPRHGSWLPGAVRPHPTRLYALTPGFSARISADDTFGSMDIDINADGLRERPLESLRTADLRILALGDSYTFGYGIEAAQAWPRRLEGELRRLMPTRPAAVINAGIPGYSLAQMQDMLREMLPKTAPQAIVAAVYAGGFGRMLNPMTSLGDLVIRSTELRVVRLVDGGLVRSPMYNQAIVDIDLWLKTHWYSGAWLFDGAYVIADAAREGVRELAGGAPAEAGIRDPMIGVAGGLAALEGIRRRASEAGIPLIVLAIASFGPDHRVNRTEAVIIRELARFCAGAGITFVDPTDELEEAAVPVRVRPSDYHWSAAANGLAAEALADFMVKQGLIAPATLAASTR